jgi:chromosome partitioning protein
VHLAVAALRDGYRVAIIDADPQGSAVAWSQARAADGPYVVAIDPGDVPKALGEAAAEGYGLIVVDTQPRASASLGHIARVADFVLIPVQPAPYDLATGEGTQRIMVAAGAPFAFILNRCPARAPEIAEGRAVLAQLGPVFDVTIGERRIYSRSLQTGRSCQEYDPSSHTAHEIERARDAGLEIARAWSELSRRAHVVSPVRAQA